MSKRAPDINARYRELEKSLNLTVISPSIMDGPCEQCGERCLTFTCDLFREPGRRIAELCKSCAISLAGGEDRVWVKTTWQGLRAKWDRNRRLEQAAHLRSALSERRSQRV